MRDFLRLMAPALKVAKERHDDPKNMVKGDYPKDKFDAWQKFDEEFVEVVEALAGTHTGKDCYEHVRDELGDMLLTTAMLLAVVEDKLLEEQGK